MQSCCITLAHVFEDEAVSEMLTTGKLSELACLTLYLMCARFLPRGGRCSGRVLG